MEMEKAETGVTKRPRGGENMLSLKSGGGGGGGGGKEEAGQSCLRLENREMKGGRGFASASGNFSCLTIGNQLRPVLS